jgi:hypothetical protein
MMSSRATADSLNYCDRLPLRVQGCLNSCRVFKGVILCLYSSACRKFRAYRDLPHFTLRTVLEVRRMCVLRAACLAIRLQL